MTRLRKLLGCAIQLFAIMVWVYSEQVQGSYTADPFTIAIIAGGVLTAKAQIDQGRAAEAAGKAEQRIAEFNALQKEREARSRVQAAELEEERVSRRAKITKARQRVAGAKGGISISESSTLDVLLETAGEFQTERALTLREGLVQSNFLKSQASVIRAGGKLSKQLGRAQKRSSFLKAGGTILSTAGAAGAFSSRTPAGVSPTGTGFTPTNSFNTGPALPSFGTFT